MVGTLMGGLLLGILLARPLSSMLPEHFGWRAVFVAAALMTLATVGVAAATVPRHVPAHRASYARVLSSLRHSFMRHPLLRQRAL
ncbi:hypothetical protein [Cupriavidus sp. D39]|uniref:hypothetical protein n=1 Tax=Cupriavidus sp. D39 TaxID=2997877 RepID=UPI003B6391D5